MCWCSKCVFPKMILNKISINSGLVEGNWNSIFLLTVSLCELFWQKSAGISTLHFPGRRLRWLGELGTKVSPPAAATQTAGQCNTPDVSSWKNVHTYKQMAIVVYRLKILNISSAGQRVRVVYVRDLESVPSQYSSQPLRNVICYDSVYTSWARVKALTQL